MAATYRHYAALLEMAEEVRALCIDLHDAGFGFDEPVSGAEVIDTINSHLEELDRTLVNVTLTDPASRRGKVTYTPRIDLILEATPMIGTMTQYRERQLCSLIRYTHELELVAGELLACPALQQTSQDRATRQTLAHARAVLDSHLNLTPED